MFSQSLSDSGRERSVSQARLVFLVLSSEFDVSRLYVNEIRCLLGVLLLYSFSSGVRSLESSLLWLSEFKKCRIWK